MDKQYAEHHYTTTVVSCNKDGYTGLELRRTSKGTTSVAATLIYWDAAGQFYLEAFAELPLAVVEDLIAEAKATIKTR